ncbi:MAG: hypothetical protein M3R61_20510 [Chloroflexota bacterium]|nr:hypothetical protein [Chloroflexota bacterium]
MRRAFIRHWWTAVFTVDRPEEDSIGVLVEYVIDRRDLHPSEGRRAGRNTSVGG